MATVFVLQHVHEREGVEDVKFIGVYSSLDKARAAEARLRERPGFSDEPDGFHIDEYPLDQDQWSEGYVAVGGE